MIIRHTNAGASDLDRASIGLLESTLALEDSQTPSGVSKKIPGTTNNGLAMSHGPWPVLALDW